MNRMKYKMAKLLPIPKGENCHPKPKWGGFPLQGARGQRGRYILVLLIFLSTSISSIAQKEKSHVRQGNIAYENEDFQAAAEFYRKGIEENTYSYEANFNLGDALYKQGEFESATGQFDVLRQPGMDKSKLAKVYHNIGNGLLEQQKYAESVEAFKEALRNNPADSDSRYNLVYAMQKLEDQQCQQQDQQQDQENQDEQQEQQENQEQEQQENQEQQEQEEEQQEQQNQQEQEQQQEQGQQGQEEQPKDELSRQEAERILQALQMDEQELHDDMKKKKIKGQRVTILKDW